MGTIRQQNSVMSHPIVITFLILAVITALSFASEVLKPLALSILLAFALTPVSKLLERARIPRAVAVVLTLVFALGALAGVGFVVGNQMTQLTLHLPEYKNRVLRKIEVVLNPAQGSAMKKAERVVQEISETIADSTAGSNNATDVRVVQEPSFRERLQSAVGPYLEFLGVASFVLVLVLFMMLSREDLRDRTLRLFGQTHIGLTTRTMNEIGQRISRYLATFTAMNTCYGAVIGVGLHLIGLPMAILWGCIAGFARFIPYVGTAVAFSIPVLYSVAYFDGWLKPLEVLLLFAVIESALSSVIEPIVYGKTTGVTALGLLVAAMFWTWLWGLMGLLLSTPLTVCLAVLGKYVPSLGIFATMLGEESELDPDVRFYQRLLALDRDSAEEIVETMLATQTKAEVFDRIIVPALSLAERDAAAGYLEEDELVKLWRVVNEIIEDISTGTESPGEQASSSPATPVILGIAADDTADALVLKMLSQLVLSKGFTIDRIEASTPMQLAERVAERNPAMVVISHLPPRGLTSARYQVRRLRAHFSSLPILVGRWGGLAPSTARDEGLSTAGASVVAYSLADAGERIATTLAGPSDAQTAREFLTPLPVEPGLNAVAIVSKPTFSNASLSWSVGTSSLFGGVSAGAISSDLGFAG